MTGKTHIALGLLVTEMIMPMRTPELAAINISFAIIGSMMPDIDISNSKISHKVKKFIAFAVAILMFSHYILKMPYASIFKAVGSYKIFNAGILLLIVLMLFSKTTEHRTFTHSILGLILFSISTFLILKQGTVSFILGYAAHLFADWTTDSGIMIIYPSKKKVSLHLIKTNSLVDHMMCIFAMLLFYLRLASQYSTVSLLMNIGLKIIKNSVM